MIMIGNNLSSWLSSVTLVQANPHSLISSKKGLTTDPSSPLQVQIFLIGKFLLKMVVYACYKYGTRPAKKDFKVYRKLFIAVLIVVLSCMMLPIQTPSIGSKFGKIISLTNPVENSLIDCRFWFQEINVIWKMIVRQMQKKDNNTSMTRQMSLICSSMRCPPKILTMQSQHSKNQPKWR